MQEVFMRRVQDVEGRYRTGFGRSQGGGRVKLRLECGHWELRAISRFNHGQRVRCDSCGMLATATEPTPFIRDLWREMTPAFAKQLRATIAKATGRDVASA